MPGARADKAVIYARWRRGTETTAGSETAQQMARDRTQGSEDFSRRQSRSSTWLRLKHDSQSVQQDCNLQEP